MQFMMSLISVCEIQCMLVSTVMEVSSNENELYHINFYR